MRRRGFLGSAPALMLAACSPGAVVNALVPEQGYRRLSDLAYGEGPRHRLDLYVPDAGRPPFPVLLFFYGGAWRSGERSLYPFLGEAFATRGYALAVADYRLYPEVAFPGFLEDGAAAFAWLAANAGRLGLDERRLFLMGHSAGAYNAAMLTLDERWLAARGLDARRAIRGAVCLAGPYDFLPFRGGFTRDIFGAAPDPAATQPINHVDGSEAPMLLLAGLDDTTVYPRNTTALADRIREKGGRVETRLYPGVGHIPLIGAYAGPLRWVAPALDDTVRFLQEVGA